MSTSHYSRPPYRGPQPPPNTRRRTLLYSGAFWALTMADIAAIGMTTDRLTAAVSALLTLVNCAVILRILR